MNKLIMSVYNFMSSLFGYAPKSFMTVGVDDFETGIQGDAVQLVDVRTASEYKEGTIGNSIHMDIMKPDFLKKAESMLDPSRPVYVFCRTGHRSATASKMLAKDNFHVINLDGGIVAWIAAGKETIVP
ncbi:MAG: rhodanese-like domain-containing protein [Prevotella sp.]|jgi:rhodanese-related sulfurtransferase|nr:rhodanese-like domain-containing protein [Prevotella sp.]MCI2103363.1 rhodanese-like domain-containing protein [Prevotella sp.]HCN52902.1 rhodanese [Prevotella sp.]